MTFCIGCGHQMHETASSCCQCGTEQKLVTPQHNTAILPGGISLTKFKPGEAVVVALAVIGLLAAIGTQL